MTETLTKIVVNCETGEQIIEPLTAEEIAQRETDRLAYEAAETIRLAEEAAKAEAKVSANSKLAALGLTEEEIAAITA